MKFHYDLPTDSLYISLTDNAGAETVIINDDIVADIDAQGRLTGLDIQHAGQYYDLGNFILSGFNPMFHLTEQ